MNITILTDSINSMVATSDPVNSLIDLSKAVREQDISNMLSALMILTFITLGTFLLKVVYSAIKNITKSLQQINTNNNDILAQNAVVINNLSDLLKSKKSETLLEQNRWNTERLLEKSFSCTIVDIMSGTIEIIDKNHIIDEDFTYDRVNAMVRSAHYDRVKWLNNFTYSLNGIATRIGEISDKDEWVENIITIVYNFIYIENRDKDILFRELKLAYKEFNNQLELN